MKLLIFQKNLDKLLSDICLLGIKAIFIFVIFFPYEGTRIYFQKQVIADSYRKKFYGRIPESWITPIQKQEIINQVRKKLEKEWDAQAIRLENYITKDEMHSLKCHPPFSMKITIKVKKDEKDKHDEVTKETDDTIKDKHNRIKMFMLIVYPRSYRTIIEDPLEPPPLDYLGNTKLLALYLFQVDSKNKDYQEKKKVIMEKIKEAFSLESE